MKIIIDNDQPVSLIREQFNRTFPYLKIEFLAGRQAVGAHGTGYKEPWSRKIGELRRAGSAGRIDVSPEMRVRELEQVFRKKYGLGVQVFRRFGRDWLKTGRTGNRTLSSLNSLGKRDALRTENDVRLS